jgi:hypothetical protein
MLRQPWKIDLLRGGHKEPHNPRNGCQNKYRLDAQPRDIGLLVGDGSDLCPCRMEIEKKGNNR